MSKFILLKECLDFFFSGQQDKILIKKIIFTHKSQLQFAVPTQKRPDAALTF